eukprot:gene166-778_t
MAANMKKSFSRKFLYFSGFLDLFGVSLLIPLLAHEARKYGASPTLVGLFMSIYGALQFISSPLMGQASDFFGRKRILSICLFGSAIGYFMLGVSSSLLLLFVARIPTGLLKHSQAIIKAYVADVTAPEERPAALGTLNALCSSGFIIGPVIGGHIAMTENGFKTVAFLSGLIFIANSLFVAFVIPAVGDCTSQLKSNADTQPTSNGEWSKRGGVSKVDYSKRGCEPRDNETSGVSSAVNTGEVKPRGNLNPVSEFVKAVRRVPWSKVADVFLVRFLTSLAMIIFRGSFSVVLEFRHGSTPKLNGYLMSYNAVLGVLGGASVGRIAKLFATTESMHRCFSVLFVLSLGLISAAPSIGYVIVGLMPLCVSTAVLRVTSATAMYNRAGEEEKGLLTGLGDSFMSMARTIGPTLGGMAQDVNIYGPGILSTMLAVLGTSLAFVFDMGTYDINFSKKTQ